MSGTEMELRSPTGTLQKNYARHLKLFERYARDCAVHPLQARRPLADASAKHLAAAPTVVWRGGERVAAGPPRSDTAQAAGLSGCSSFCAYALLAQVLPRDAGNPFEAVLRPAVDPDYSPTEDLTGKEFGRLLVAARHRHRPRRTAHRNFALLLTMYALMLRVGSALAAQVEDLGYDRGHHVLDVRLKGGTRKKKPVPPLAWDARMIRSVAGAAPTAAVSRGSQPRGSTRVGTINARRAGCARRVRRRASKRVTGVTPRVCSFCTRFCTWRW